MARLTLYKDNYVDSTVISNCFIDEYMKDANDAQLKVYLYLIRMLNARQPVSVSSIADQFNHTEKDVIRALKYWEKKKLLSLDYDEDKTLIGIHLKDLDAKGPAAPVPMKSVRSASLQEAPVEQEMIEEEVSDPYAKPTYTAGDLKEFKAREETAQLLFIAETYKGIPLTPSEMQSMLFFKDVLHFSDDLIDYLLQYCFDRGKKSFRYIEKVAIGWARQGITTPEQAGEQAFKYEKDVYVILNALGRTGTPTDVEVGYINRWIKEYGFTMEIILEACNRTVVATDSRRLEYAEGILSSWQKADVHTKADVAAMDEGHRRRRTNVKNSATQSATVSNNRFNQFTQNSYDFDALEKELLSN